MKSRSRISLQGLFIVFFCLSLRSFYADFGPLNLAVVHRYCTKLNRKLSVRKLGDEFRWENASILFRIPH